MIKRPVTALILLATFPSLDGALTLDEPLIQITFVRQTDKLFSISAKLPTDLTVENIRLRKRRITGDWVLVFKSNEGLQVKVGNSSANGAMLDDQSYSLLIHEILQRQEAEVPQIHISKIHSDLNFVESTWRLVTSAIKRKAKDLVGTVKSKDRRITRVMAESLATSPQLRRTCRALEDYGSRCHSQHPATIDPVAFKQEVAGLPWSTLFDREDVGLQEWTWFSIQVERKAH